MAFRSFVQQHRRRLGLLIGLIVSLMGLHLCSLVSFGSSIFSSRLRDVHNLAHTLSLIEQSDMQAFRNQGWCKNIAYSRGRFSSNTQSATCNLFAGTPQPFDAQARADFDAIAHRLAATGVRVTWLISTFDASGRLQSVEFEIDCILCQRMAYVYAPGYGTLPDTIPEEVWFTAINDDWYLREEDWN